MKQNMQVIGVKKLNIAYRFTCMKSLVNCHILLKQESLFFWYSYSRVWLLGKFLKTSIKKPYFYHRPILKWIKLIYIGNLHVLCKIINPCSSDKTLENRKVGLNIRIIIKLKIYTSSIKLITNKKSLEKGSSG